MSKIRILVITALGLSFASVVHAQSSAEKFERSLEQIRQQTLVQVNPEIPLDQRVTLDYGGYISFGYLSEQDNTSNWHGLRQSELVAYARANFDGAHEFFIRYRTGYRDFNQGDSFTGRGSEPIDGDLDTAYYRFDLAKYDAAYRGKEDTNDLALKGGRDLVYWGNGLTISQTLDGGFLDATIGNLTLSMIAGETPVRTVDFDASRPAFDYNTRRGFYGAIATLQAGQQRPYVYGLIQRDDNSKDFEVIQNIPTKFDYNSWYIGFGSNGQITDRLIYGVEAVYEGGDGQSNSFTTTNASPFPVPLDQVGLRQKHETIQAWAANARLDYLMADEHHTRLSADVILASGDSDRINTSNTYAGNRVNTNDHAFNGFGLINTGLAFAPNVSNLMAFRVGGSTFPFNFGRTFSRLQLGTDLFLYNKLNREGGLDEPTDTARFLGWEPDVYLNWQLTSDVTLAARYGVFFPDASAFPIASSPARGDNRQFLFLSVTYSF
jgi:hypothetical protein